MLLKNIVSKNMFWKILYSRMKTFQRKEVNFDQMAMAEAGFYATQKKNLIKCFYCGGIVKFNLLRAVIWKGAHSIFGKYRISSYSFRPWIVSAHLCTVTFGLMYCELSIS